MDTGAFAQPTTWARTHHAQAAAKTGATAAARAAAAADLAARVGADILEENSAALNATHHKMASPTKAGYKAAANFFSTTQKAQPPTFSDPEPIEVKSYKDAVQQLTSGSAVVEFPHVAIDYEVLNTISEALKDNKTLTHLDLQQAIPSNTMVGQISKALDGNQSLVYLNLAGNKIGDMAVEEPVMDGLQNIKKLLDECESLQHADLSDNNFGAAGLEIVCQGVRESISLKRLDLSGNNISAGPDGDEEVAEAGMAALKELLTKNKFLNTLCLKNNAINNEVLESMGDALKQTTRLTHLDLSANILGSPGAGVLANIIAENKGIRVLDVSDNKVGWKGVVQLGGALMKNQSIDTLVMQKNRFGCSKEKVPPKVPVPGEEEEAPEELDPEEAEERRKEEAAKLEKESKVAEKAIAKLAEVVTTNSVLKELDIAFNTIGSKHLSVLTDVLKTNSSLTSLNLEMNHLCGVSPGEFDGTSITSLADSLAHNNTLTKLNLRWNFMQAEGAKILSDAIATNCVLTSLNLSKNFLSDHGLAHITAALTENNTVTSLGLSSNDITVAGAQSLASLLGVNKTLQILDLSENLIGLQGLDILARPIIESELKTVDLSRCTIGDCPHIVADILEQSKLEKLDLGDNPVGPASIHRALVGLRTNKSLRSLTLWGRRDGDNVQQAQQCLELLQENKNLTSLDFGFGGVDQELTAQIEGLLRQHSKK